MPGEEDGLLYAGVAPAALFESRDGGATWDLNRGMWDQPSRPDWQEGAGGLAMHSICPWPGDPSRLALGISAVGVWLSEDAGATWTHGNAGLVARYLPEDAPARARSTCASTTCIARRCGPSGCSCSSTAGCIARTTRARRGSRIAEGLPSDFGFPLAIDPGDPDSAYVIPLNADVDRVTAEGRLRVFETRDAGATWTARTTGLPQTDAYLTILRQAFGHDGRDPLGLWFGATSGEVFGSADAGATWHLAARDLAPVLSVRAA